MRLESYKWKNGWVNFFILKQLSPVVYISIITVIFYIYFDLLWWISIPISILVISVSGFYIKKRKIMKEARKYTYIDALVRTIEGYYMMMIPVTRFENGDPSRRIVTCHLPGDCWIERENSIYKKIKIVFPTDEVIATNIENYRKILGIEKGCAFVYGISVEDVDVGILSLYLTDHIDNGDSETLYLHCFDSEILFKIHYAKINKYENVEALEKEMDESPEKFKTVIKTT